MIGGMVGLTKVGLEHLRSEVTLLFMLTIIHVPQHLPAKVGFSDLQAWFWFSTSPGTWEGTDLQLLAKAALCV